MFCKGPKSQQFLLPEMERHVHTLFAVFNSAGTKKLAHVSRAAGMVGLFFSGLARLIRVSGECYRPPEPLLVSESEMCSGT